MKNILRYFCSCSHWPRHSREWEWKVTFCGNKMAAMRGLSREYSDILRSQGSIKSPTWWQDSHACLWLMVRLSPEPVLGCNSRMTTYHNFFNIILTFFGATLFQAKFNPTLFQSSIHTCPHCIQMLHPKYICTVYDITSTAKYLFDYFDINI